MDGYNSSLVAILAKLASNHSELTIMERNYIANLTNQIINSPYLAPGSEMASAACTIIRICNIVYNNMANSQPVIPDELYDALIVVCNKCGIQIPVGAPPTKFIESTAPREVGEKSEDRDERGKLIIVRRVPNLEDRMFYKSMVTNMTPPRAEDFECNIDRTKVKKKIRNVPHEYDMCGTLDKCKFVLNSDALQAGKINDPGTMIFERDFISKHLQAGILNPDHIKVMVSLKYDGISVENKIAGNEIIFSCTRGDIDNNNASDLTPIFGGSKFPRAEGLDKSQVFGAKFEYILTWSKLERIEAIFGKKYVNLRNGVIGLTGGLDARMYRDFLTPVPLETSLNIPREDEVLFMNTHLTKGIDFRYAILEGTYAEVMFMIRQYLTEADSLREYMDFAYDGIVVEYLDPNVRAMLGKRGSVPLYSIAIKFDPLKKYSTFTGYTYTVGQDGVITPMAHFLPVYFYGNKQDHVTAHSYERFKNLNLRVGDKVLLTYNNEVMTYLTKAPQEMQNPNNQNPPIEFPDNCPSCGQPLYISESGASVFCANFWCPERALARLSNTLKKLGVKGFSERTVYALGVTHLSELYNYDVDEMERRIGKVNTSNFLSELRRIQNAGLPDYKLIGSIGFTGIAEKTWKNILEQFPIDRVLTEADPTFRYLEAIDGIGSTTVDTIIKERPYFLEELKFIFSTFKYTKSAAYTGQTKQQVVMTGFRDKELCKLLNDTGIYDADPNNGLTKKTAILVVPYVNYTEGSKIGKAFGLLSQSYSKVTGMSQIPINWTNLHMVNGINGVAPRILTKDEAYQLAQSIQN